MPHPDPFRAATLLIVDGRNVIGAARRSGGDLPEQALIARLRSLVAAGSRIDLVLDGARDPGMVPRDNRVRLYWSGRETADDVIVQIVTESPDGTLVVTDDRELGVRARSRGASTIGSRALLDRLSRQHAAAPAVGGARPIPPSPPRSALGDDGVDGTARPAWQPGRGATKKKGNPKRGHAPR